jgi:hypothetical protein
MSLFKKSVFFLREYHFFRIYLLLEFSLLLTQIIMPDEKCAVHGKESHDHWNKKVE